MSAIQEGPAPVSDPLTDAAGVLIKVALGLLLLLFAVPVLVGVVAYRRAPVVVAQRSWFWRSRRSYGVSAVAGVVVVAAVMTAGTIVVARYVGTEVDGWADGEGVVQVLWPWVLANLIVSPLAIPAGWLLARRGIAAQVAARTMPDSVRQDRIVEARHSGAQKDAEATARELHAAQLVGREKRPAIGYRIETGVKTLSERSHTPRRPVPDWESGRYVALPGQLSAVRSIVLAESGHGKTVLLTSLVLCALRQGGRVVFLDAKGQRSDAQAMVEAVQAAGYSGRLVNGVRVLGEDVDAESTYEVLTVQWPASGGAEDFYRGRHRDVIRAALRGKPRTLAALLQLMSLNPGVEAWEGVPREIVATLTAKAEGGMTAGQSAAQALRQAWGSAGERISGDVDLLDFGQIDAQFTVLPVRPRQEADRLLGLAAMMAFGQHLSSLQARTEPATDEPPMLVIVDEFPQLVQDGIDPSDEAASLMETARSAGLGLVVAAQSVAGLSSEPTMRARLLTSGASVFVGATKDPEEVIRLAGTQRRMEAAEAVTEGVVTSGRSQDTFVIPPDRVRAAPVGTWWLIHKGAVAEFAGLMPAARTEHDQPKENESDE